MFRKKLFLATSDKLPPKTSKVDRAFFDLQGASGHISLLLLSKTFGKKLFFTLKKTNIFLVYPHIWLYGFSLFIQGYGKNALYDYESQDNRYFFNQVKKK